MAVIERFEDIEAWKCAREVTKIIYRLSSIGEFSRDYGLKDQIRRSSVSVMSNIAEGLNGTGIGSLLIFLASRNHRAARLDHNSMSEWIKVLFRLKSLKVHPITSIKLVV